MYQLKKRHCVADDKSDWCVVSVGLQKESLDGEKLSKMFQYRASTWVTGPPGNPPNNPVPLREGKLPEMVKWTMIVHTGNLKGAGTDAGIKFNVEYRQLQVCYQCFCFRNQIKHFFRYFDPGKSFLDNEK